MKREFKENEWYADMTAKEFSEAGALWTANKELHKIGIVLQWHPEEGIITPHFTKLRGYDEKVNVICQERLDIYLEEHGEAIKAEELL